MIAMSLCDNPVVGGLCDDVEQAVGAANPIAGLGEAMGGIAEFMIRSMWGLLGGTTLVDLRAEHFERVYNLVFGIAVFVMLGFFLLQVLTGMIRREPGALARALTGLAKSVLGSFVVVALTATLLEIVDRVCLGIVTASGTTMERMEAQLVAATVGGTAFAIRAPGAGALLMLFLGGLAAGAAFITWMSLLVRKALLLVSVVFAPLALAGASWDATRGWVSRWAQLVVALILSKLVLVVVLLLATSTLSAPLDADLASVSEPLTGVVLLLVAGFAPYLTYRAISFIGFDLYQSMHAEQEAKQALNRPMPYVPNVSRPAPPSVLRSSGAGGGESATAGSGTSGSPAAPSGSGAAVGAARGGSGVAAGAAQGGAGAGGAGAGGAAGAGAAVAGPIAAAAVLAGAAVAAGPRAGRAVGGAASGAADATGGSASRAGSGRSGPVRSGSRRTAAAPQPPTEPKRSIPGVLPGGDKR